MVGKTICRNIMFSVMLSASIAIGATTVGLVSPAQASIYDSGFERKIKMTASQRSKVNRIISASNKRFNAIFRKFGINKSAKPKMSKLIDASGPLQAAASQERNDLAKVLTPTQLQQYDKIMRETEDKIVRAAN